MWHKSRAFEKFLQFIFWAESQLRKTLKKYCTNKEGEFDKKALKNR